MNIIHELYVILVGKKEVFNGGCLRLGERETSVDALRGRLRAGLTGGEAPHRENFQSRDLVARLEEDKYQLYRVVEVPLIH